MRDMNVESWKSHRTFFQHAETFGDLQNVSFNFLHSSPLAPPIRNRYLKIEMEEIQKEQFANTTSTFLEIASRDIVQVSVIDCLEASQKI